MTTATVHPFRDRTQAQRDEALLVANDVRVRRARLKKQINAGRVSTADVLADPPYYVETMKLFDLLLSVPKVGRVKANKLVQQARISPSKTVGGLSPRQRGEMLALLAHHGQFPARARRAA